MQKLAFALFTTWLWLMPGPVAADIIPEGGPWEKDPGAWNPVPPRRPRELPPDLFDEPLAPAVDPDEAPEEADVVGLVMLFALAVMAVRRSEGRTA